MKRIIGNKMKVFVLVVILIVIVVIGLLGMPEASFAVSSDDWKRAATIEIIMEIEQALENYRSDNGFYPTTEQGLDALLYTRVGYMRAEGFDPWRRPFIYRSHGGDGPIDIISCGPDGIEGTEDDVTNHDEDYKKAKAEKIIKDPRVPYIQDRIKFVGDLPDDHDPTLVLRKGRAVTVISDYNISGSNHSTLSYSYTVKEDIYDDSNQNLLIPRRIRFNCAYRISEEQDKVRIDFTAMGMQIGPIESFTETPSMSTTPFGGMLPIVMLTSPPRYMTPYESVAHFFDNSYREEYLQQREQFFLYPAMSAELIFSVESEDHTSERGKVIFGENASGDRMISISPGYEIDLQVKKDILFFGPFFD